MCCKINTCTIKLQICINRAKPGKNVKYAKYNWCYFNKNDINRGQFSSDFKYLAHFNINTYLYII